MTSDSAFPKIVHVGISGLLVSFDSVMSASANRAALQFHASVKNDPIAGVLETSPSLVSVFVKYDAIGTDPEVLKGHLLDRLQAKDWYQDAGPPTRLWQIPYSLDGPQVNEVAQMLNCSPADCAEDISSTDLSVLTLGFAPGQPYLGSLPDPWGLPRMQGINPQVPAGALVTAVHQLIIFANAAPTGWRHIGNVAFRCFDPDRAEAIAFQPGDSVRFHQVSPSEINALREAPDGLGGARFEVRA